MQNYKIRTSFIDKSTIVYYVSQRKIETWELLNGSAYDEIIASAHIVTHTERNFDRDFIMIVGLSVKPPFQNLGIGSKLLEKILAYAKNSGKTMIKVDDMSQRYRCEHNIYSKFGFKYEDQISGPEMELDLLSN